MPIYEDPMERGKTGMQGGTGESSRSSGQGVGAIREKAYEVGHGIRDLAETTRDVAREQQGSPEPGLEFRELRLRDDGRAAVELDGGEPASRLAGGLVEGIEAPRGQRGGHRDGKGRLEKTATIHHVTSPTAVVPPLKAERSSSVAA